MSKINEVLNRIEAQEMREAIPDHIPLMQIADMVVRGKLKLSQPQMRLLIELLPYHAPKLTAVATTSLDGGSFAALLDKAIERSRAPLKLIEAEPVEQHPPEEMKGPMKGLRRY